MRRMAKRTSTKAAKIWYCVSHHYEATDSDDAHRHQRHVQSLCQWEFMSPKQVSPFGASEYDLAIDSGELSPDLLYGITAAPDSLIPKQEKKKGRS